MGSEVRERRQPALVRLGCLWLLLSGFSPGPDPVDGVDAPALAPAPAPPPKAAKRASAKWRLSIDTSILADSNVTNSTDDRSIVTYQGNTVIPVPLDPALRAHDGIGASVAVAAGAELPVSEAVWLVVDAEALALDYGGDANDDSSMLVGAGPLVRWDGGEASVQLILFDRWYGGISASSGTGIRSRYQAQVAPGQRIVLIAEARFFESDYGTQFGGSQGGLYLTYESVLDPLTAASAGVFARRDWLREDAYSSLELGAYGGLSRYLGPDLTGSLSAGLSRVLFDAPVQFLSPERREDWRFYATLSLTTRRPIGWGVHPSLSYSYNRTRSSTQFFGADRHRLRFGLSRNF